MDLYPNLLNDKITQDRSHNIIMISIYYRIKTGSNEFQEYKIRYTRKSLTFIKELKFNVKGEFEGGSSVKFI